MSNHDQDVPSYTESSNSPPVDESGETVDVVERDIRDDNAQTRIVDEVITPTSTRAKEQDAQTINDKSAEIERKIADGH